MSDKILWPNGQPPTEIESETEFEGPTIGPQTEPQMSQIAVRGEQGPRGAKGDQGEQGPPGELPTLVADQFLSNNGTDIFWAPVNQIKTFADVYADGGTGGGTFTLDDVGGGFSIKDAATPITGNLFSVKSNDGVSSYFAVTTAGASILGVPVLAVDQAGQGGRFLTTNGTVASWATLSTVKTLQGAYDDGTGVINLSDAGGGLWIKDTVVQQPYPFFVSNAAGNAPYAIISSQFGYLGAEGEVYWDFTGTILSNSYGGSIAVIAPALESTAGNSYTASVLDGATYAAHRMDTAAAITSGKLLSVRNNNTEKFYIDANGLAYCGGLPVLTSASDSLQSAYTGGTGVIALNSTDGAIKIVNNATPIGTVFWVTDSTSTYSFLKINPSAGFGTNKIHLSTADGTNNTTFCAIAMADGLSMSLNGPNSSSISIRGTVVSGFDGNNYSGAVFNDAASVAHRFVSSVALTTAGSRIATFGTTSTKLGIDKDGSVVPVTDNSITLGDLTHRVATVYGIAHSSGASATSFTTTVATGSSRAGFIFNDTNNSGTTDKLASFQIGGSEKLYLAQPFGYPAWVAASTTLGLYNSNTDGILVGSGTVAILTGSGARLSVNSTSVNPGSDNTYALGTSSLRYSSVYTPAVNSGASALTLTSGITDGAGVAGVILDTTNSIQTGKATSFRTGGAEIAYLKYSSGGNWTLYSTIGVAKFGAYGSESFYIDSGQNVYPLADNLRAFGFPTLRWSSVSTLAVNSGASTMTYTSGVADGAAAIGHTIIGTNIANATAKIASFQTSAEKSYIASDGSLAFAAANSGIYLGGTGGAVNSTTGITLQNTLLNFRASNSYVLQLGATVMIPITDNSYALGDATHRYSSLYTLAVNSGASQMSVAGRGVKVSATTGSTDYLATFDSGDGSAGVNKEALLIQGPTGGNLYYPMWLLFQNRGYANAVSLQSTGPQAGLQVIVPGAASGSLFLAGAYGKANRAVTSSATPALTFADSNYVWGQVITSTVSANITGATLTAGAISGMMITLMFVKDSTNNAYTIAFGGTNVVAEPITMSTTPSCVVSVQVEWDATNSKWRQIAPATYASKTYQFDGLATAQTVALSLSNTTPAALGAQQYSPVIEMAGLGWDSTASASKASKWGLQARPVQTAGTPDGDLVLWYSSNAAAYSEKGSFRYRSAADQLQLLGSTTYFDVFNGSTSGIRMLGGTLTLLAGGTQVAEVTSAGAFRPPVDNLYTLGDATHRWSAGYLGSFVISSNVINCAGQASFYLQANSVYVATLSTDGSIKPGTSDNTQNLGSAALRWNTLYSTNVNSGASALTATSTVASGSSRSAFIFNDTNGTTSTDKVLELQIGGVKKGTFGYHDIATSIFGWKATQDTYFLSSSGDGFTVQTNAVYIYAGGTYKYRGTSTAFEPYNDDNTRTLGSSSLRWATTYTTAVNSGASTLTQTTTVATGSSRSGFVFNDTNISTASTTDKLIAFQAGGVEAMKLSYPFGGGVPFWVANAATTGILSNNTDGIYISSAAVNMAISGAVKYTFNATSLTTNTDNTYTLGDSTHRFATTYTLAVNSGASDLTVGTGSGASMLIRQGGAEIIVSGATSGGFRPSIDNNTTLGYPTLRWSTIHVGAVNSGASTLSMTSGVADGAAAIAHKFDTGVAMSTAGAAIASFQTNAVEKYAIRYSSTFGIWGFINPSGSGIATSGNFVYLFGGAGANLTSNPVAYAQGTTFAPYQDNVNTLGDSGHRWSTTYTLAVNSGASTLAMTSGAAMSGTGVAYSFDTTNAATNGDKLMTFKWAGTERAYIEYGNLAYPTLRGMAGVGIGLFSNDTTGVKVTTAAIQMFVTNNEILDLTTTAVKPGSDNAITSGTSSLRWSTIYGIAFDSGASSMLLKTGATTAVTIDSSQNVGIGVAPSLARLHVTSTATPGYFKTSDASGGVSTMILDTAGGSFSLPFISFRDNTTEYGMVGAWPRAAAFGFVQGLNLYAPSGNGIGVRIGGTAAVNLVWSWASTGKFLCSPTITADGVGALQNSSVSGYSSMAFNDNGGTLRGSIGYGNASVGLTNLAGKLFMYLGPNASNNEFVFGNDTNNVFKVNASTTTVSPMVQTSGAPVAFLLTGAAHTGMTTLTEVPDVNFNLARTVQWATGAITTQRAFLIQAPTYGFVGSSTITNAATFAITAAPTAGTNATITNAYALWVQAGATRLDGNVTTTNDTYNLGDATHRWLGVYTTTVSSAASNLTVNGASFVNFSINSNIIAYTDSAGIKPNADNTQILGDSTHRFSTVYAVTHDSGGSDMTLNANAKITVQTGKFITAATSATTPPAITWTGVSFLNSWVDFNTSTHQAVGYYKDAMGWVHIRGAAKTGTSGTIAFQLPAGYRPTKEINFCGLTSGGHCQIKVGTTGDVTITQITGAATAFTSLDGIEFYAEA